MQFFTSLNYQMSQVVKTKSNVGGGGSRKKRATNAEKISEIRQTIRVKDTVHNLLYCEFESTLRHNIQVNREIKTEQDDIALLEAEIKRKKATIIEKKKQKNQIAKTILKQQKELRAWDEIIHERIIGKRVELKRQIQTLEIKDNVVNAQKALVLCEKENKKKASKTIIDEINQLPEIIVSYIGEFIPYEIRNQLIEDKYNPMKQLVPRLDRFGLSRLIKQFYLHPKYFAQLTTEEAEQNTDRSLTYSPAWWGDTRSNMMARLMRPVVEMKNKDPELAYKFLSTIAILIKPDKKYTHGFQNAR
jgi:hypothetical protein